MTISLEFFPCYFKYVTKIKYTLLKSQQIQALHALYIFLDLYIFWTSYVIRFLEM